jgi:hypothetical protein
MSTYKVLKTFQDGGIQYNPGDYAELDDNTAVVHAEHGNIELEPVPEPEPPAHVDGTI